MTDKLLSLASEKGKIIVNKCLDKGYLINTPKLTTLLILIQGLMLLKHDCLFFDEKILATSKGLKINEVDEAFNRYIFKFREKQQELITLSEIEEILVEDVLSYYGELSNYQIIFKHNLNYLNQIFYEEDRKFNVISPEVLIKFFKIDKQFDFFYIESSEDRISKVKK